MENRYYTPNIEEFHVGFEFEANINNHWIRCQITDWYDGLEGEYRVKYLDKEDIESLGWVYDSKDFYHLTINNRLYRLRWFPNNAYDWIGIYSLGANINLTLFDGSIKNKTELKRLMKQLNINGKN